MSRISASTQGLGRDWQVAAFLTALGAVVLGAGLLLGPTPSDDPAQALRDIDGFRARYIATNAIDLVGVLLLAAGLIALGRLQLQAGGGATAAVGAAANAAGGALIALTLVLQSTLDPAVAERFVAASAADQAAVLAAGQAALEVSGAVFGTAFLLQMLGIALLAITFIIGAGPRLNRPFLAVGALIALGASTMGIGALFEDALGQVEAMLGLVALLWLVVLSALVARAPDG